MPLFKVEHLQAVWERAFFIVEADNEDDACNLNQVVDTWFTKIDKTAVDGIDSEIVSVEPYTPEI